MGAAPFAFLCPEERKFRVVQEGHSPDNRVRVERHVVIRTGNVKPNPSRNRGSRSLGNRHEYVCLTCGRVGWTIHKDILSAPVRDEIEL